jgi:beta-lactamase regulating signal transducer with metallopeptidase domain
VLLAHEASHLRHRHHLYLHLIWLAGAANPLVRPIGALVASAVERWADEDAADEVGDRRLAAHGLGRAALAAAEHHRLPGALAAAEHDVSGRVRALLRPAPAGGSAPVLIAVVAAAACWVAAAITVFWGNALIQLAESAYHR